jgi:muconolactone delta-isomerase
VEFLVQIQVTLPPELSSTDRQELMEREQARGRELKNEGIIRRIWRIPGRTANVGIWDAADPTALHEALSSLPMFPYIDASVTALATHYLEA